MESYSLSWNLRKPYQPSFTTDNGSIIMSQATSENRIQGLLRVRTDLFEVRGRCGLPMELSIFSFGRPEIETAKAFSEERV